MATTPADLTPNPFPEREEELEREWLRAFRVLSPRRFSRAERGNRQKQLVRRGFLIGKRGREVWRARRPAPLIPA